MLHGFLPFSPMSLTEVCSFWYGNFETFLHFAQVSGQSCPWPLKLMMSEAVEWMWICTGGYGWLRAKWVNSACCHKVSYLHVESHCLCISRGFVILFGDSCKVEKNLIICKLYLIYILTGSSLKYAYCWCCHLLGTLSKSLLQPLLRRSWMRIPGESTSP